MKRTLLLILCAVLYMGTLSAQIKLSGRVIDKTNQHGLSFRFYYSTMGSNLIVCSCGNNLRIIVGLPKR